MYTTTQMDRISDVIAMADSCDCMDIYTAAKMSMEVRITEYLMHCFEDVTNGYDLDVMHVTDTTLEWWTHPGDYAIRTNFDGVVRDFELPCDNPEQLAVALYTALTATRGEHEHVWLDDVFCWALVQ